MDYQNLLVEIADGVATVTVNRPKKLNALNAETVKELLGCFSVLRDDPAVRCVILTGSGEKAFVAGADIKELAEMDADKAERTATRGHELMWKIENLGKPVIAAVNGFALGGGCELALACTFRYAADNAQLGLPETGLGLIPGYGGTQRLPRVVGRGRALEMILTGGYVPAAEACEIGLVNRVLPADELLPAVKKIAAGLAGKSSMTLRLALKAVNEGAAMNQDAACRFEASIFGIAGSSEDAAEGCRAFLEKRKPDFRN